MYDGQFPLPGRRPDERRRVFPMTLKQHRGNIIATACALGISRKTAYRWWKELKAGTLLSRLPPA